MHMHHVHEAKNDFNKHPQCALRYCMWWLVQLVCHVFPPTAGMLNICNLHHPRRQEQTEELVRHAFQEGPH